MAAVRLGAIVLAVVLLNVVAVKPFPKLRRGVPEVLAEKKVETKKACCQAGRAPTDKEPCIPCSQTDHVNPQKCPCPEPTKDGKVPNYPDSGSFGCVKVRCADPPGDISVMPKRCPHDKFCGGATGKVAAWSTVAVTALLVSVLRL